MLAETWYKSDREVFKLPDYNTHSVNQPSHRGGGVAMLIDKLVSYELLSEYCPSTDDYDVLSIKIDEHVASVFYRSPDRNFLKFRKFLDGFFLCL